MSGKAAGTDSIPLEAIKADPHTTVGMLYELFGKIWEEVEMPTEWNESHIINLSKKGDLLAVVGKILNRVTLICK